MNMQNILVCGYTGRLGRRVATLLRDEHGLQPSLLIRPHHLKDGWVTPEGMRVISGSFESAADLEVQLQKMNAVFLVSPVHPDMHDRELTLARAAFKANSDVHIVKISGLGTRLDSFVDSGRWHAEIERDIRSMGVRLTALQPYFFMQNLAFQIGTVRKQGVLRGAIKDSPIAMIDERDIAETAARVLVGGTQVEGTSVRLTGPATQTYPEIAELLAHLLATKVVYQDQSDEQIEKTLTDAGQPAWHIQILLQFNEAFRRGWGADITDVVPRVLGRPARPLAACLQELIEGSQASSGTDPYPS
jgi:uncharacterized protein YbjT (DUF2867 family)